MKAVVYRKYGPPDVLEMEEVERVVAQSSEDLQQLYAAYPNMLVPWVNEVARNSQVVDAVKAVLGPNVLLWMASVFIKEPGVDVFRPEAATTDDRKPSMLVAVTAESEIWVNRRVYQQVRATQKLTQVCTKAGEMHSGIQPQLFSIIT